MNDNTSVEKYTETYTSFSGADIVASFNGVVIGELQGITYSVSRDTVIQAGHDLKIINRENFVTTIRDRIRNSYECEEIRKQQQRLYMMRI